ncbi:hypothetical protein [Bacillus cereus]|uniref:hypothetical protein n=1 Tax=Bacillus cereus TaxID=1396 RepID=UPI003CFD0556
MTTTIQISVCDCSLKKDYSLDEGYMKEVECAMEQIKSMSEDELSNRLIKLYVEEEWGQGEYDLYEGSFSSLGAELLYIELQVSSELADQAYLSAMESYYQGELKYEPKRFPMSETFTLTYDYILISKDKDWD